jgi:hypothetical protein
MFGADSHNVKKQGSPRHPPEIVVKAPAPPCKAESLAGETRQADIEWRDVFFRNFRYIPGNIKTVREVGAVSLYRVSVPFAGKYRPERPAERLFEAEPDTAHAGEQVY